MSTVHAHIHIDDDSILKLRKRDGYAALYIDDKSFIYIPQVWYTRLLDILKELDDAK
jgi:hypothetical protein